MALLNKEMDLCEAQPLIIALYGLPGLDINGGIHCKQISQLTLHSENAIASRRARLRVQEKISARSRDQLNGQKSSIASVEHARNLPDIRKTSICSESRENPLHRNRHCYSTRSKVSFNNARATPINMSTQNFTMQ
jgi:hypothetical protein